MGKREKRRAVAGITVAIVVVTCTMVILGAFRDRLFFDAGSRYDDSRLDDMDVIYTTRADICAFNEGYSESATCPWGFVHNGIDYFFVNDSTVIAAAPGKVTDMGWRDYGESVENRFHAWINIRFNKTVVLGYNFEPWTQDPADNNHQVALFNVSKGEWVEKGQSIASFLAIGSGAHIHFDVRHGNDQTCPQPFFSTAGYTELMGMIHDYHPTWDLCYP